MWQAVVYSGISLACAMRILFVFGTLELGGSERQALLLARHLASEQGVHVEVWGFEGPGQVSSLCEEYGVPWRVVPLPWSRNRIGTVKKLAEFAWELRRCGADVILPYTIFPNVVCGLVWRWTGARLCIWNQRDEGIGHVPQRVRRFAARMVPLFISNSGHGADFLIRTLGVDAGRIKVIHNGVELAKPLLDRRAWRERLEVGEDAFLACMVASLTAFKDHRTLLLAWRKVTENSNMRDQRKILLLAGRFDNTYDSLKVLAQDLELGESVRFLGKVEDIPGLLAAVDLGVFSSLSEGLPNGVLECMASGLAVAGTDIPGIRDAVGPAGYAFLAPPGDAEALANRIVRLATDRNLRADIAAVNRRRIETEFSPNLMCQETVALVRGRLGS